MLYHVEEDPAEILRHDLEFTDLRVHILLQVELELRISRPRAVIGEPRVLVQQSVDVRGLPIA